MRFKRYSQAKQRCCLKAYFQKSGADIFLYFKNDRNEKIECAASVRFAVDDECKERYDEYVFDASAADLAGYEAYGYFVASDLHLTGNWSVTFPLDSVSQ